MRTHHQKMFVPALEVLLLLPVFAIVSRGAVPATVPATRPIELPYMVLLSQSARAVTELTKQNRPQEALHITQSLCDQLVEGTHKAIKPSLNDLLFAVSLCKKVDDKGSRAKLALACGSQLTLVPRDHSLSVRQIVGLSSLICDTGSQQGMAEVRWFAMGVLGAETATHQLTFSETSELLTVAKQLEYAELRDAVLLKLHERYLSDDGKGIFRLNSAGLLSLSELLSDTHDTEGASKLTTLLADVYFPAVKTNLAIPGNGLAGLIRFVASAKRPDLAKYALQELRKGIASGRISVTHATAPQLSDTVNAFEEFAEVDADGVNSIKSLLASEWLGLTPTWQQIDPAIRRSLFFLIQGDATAVANLDGLARDLKQGQRLSGVNATAVASALLQAQEKKLAGEWASESFRVFINADSSLKETDSLLANSLRILSASGTKLSKDDFVLLLAHFDKLDVNASLSDDAVFHDLATIAQTGNYGALVEEKLRNPNGDVNLALARVIAWSRHDLGNIRPFIAELGNMFQGSKGDTLAKWELARAYAASLTGSPIRRTDGNVHLQHALSAAESDAMRLICLRELAEAGIASASYRFPLQVIQSTESQFSGAQLQELLQIKGRLTELASTSSNDVRQNLR